MFGVSFSELGLIFVVALVVIGPARLPGLVRKIGRWVGKARSMARDFQQQLESEINLEELNRLTDVRTKEAQSQPKPAATTAAAPAAAPEPPTEQPAGNPSAAQDQLASSGYPYGVQASDTDAPNPGDDTYSHAHAEGAAPAFDEPVEDATEQKKEDGAAGAA